MSLMSLMSRTLICRTGRRESRALILGGVLLGVALTFLGTGHHEAAPAARVAPAGAPTIAPGLILRPRSVTIAGDLPNNLHLSGAYYPAYPGRNAFYLIAQQGGASPTRNGRIALSATMPGMAMPPIRAALAASGQGYRGDLTLPMFGVYRVAVVISASQTRASGTITVTLPLPGR